MKLQKKFRFLASFVSIPAMILSILVFSLVFPVFAQDYPGLPTRSQNPILQSYLIPTTPLDVDEGWAFSHSLYVTNTYQTDNNQNENLIIDGENIRYDFQAAYKIDRWTFGITLALVDHQGGGLDQVIEDWHDFFGLPQGGRDNAPRDRINYSYTKDGIDIINIQQPATGLGDIQLSASYALSENQSIWFTLELPSSESSELISNQKTDVALGYAYSHSTTDKLTGYGTLGIVLPADKGLFENRLKKQVVFAQYGLNYAFDPAYHFLLQADYHSNMVKNSNLDALDHSLQMQFGLRLPRLFEKQLLDIFFSEDILPGHAPDITFAIRLSPVVF